MINLAWSLLPGKLTDAQLARAAEVGIVASTFSPRVNWQGEAAKSLLANLVSLDGESLETIRLTLDRMLEGLVPMDFPGFRKAKTDVIIELEKKRVVWLADQSDLSSKARQRVEALPVGVPPAAMVRAFQGAYIEDGLLRKIEEVKEQRPGRRVWSDPMDKKTFDSLMHSLFHPRGEHYGVNVDTAFRALDSLVGKNMSRWDLNQALGDLRRQDWVTDQHCQEAIDTVCRQCGLPKPTLEQAKDAINLGLSWLRHDATDDEMKRAAQIGLIRYPLSSRPWPESSWRRVSS